VPCVYDGSPLSGADDTAMPSRTRPGAPAVDAPIEGGWLIDKLGGRFQLLAIDAQAPGELDVGGVPIETLTFDTRKTPSNAVRERYLGEAPSAIYLMRPDQHVAARWLTFDRDAVVSALQAAIGRA